MMTHDERIRALLGLVDPARADALDRGPELVVLGLAQALGKGYRPTTAGWVLLGDRGRAFQYT
jgi:hypothetical protein